LIERVYIAARDNIPTHLVHNIFHHVKNCGIIVKYRKSQCWMCSFCHWSTPGRGFWALASNNQHRRKSWVSNVDITRCIFTKLPYFISFSLQYASSVGSTLYCCCCHLPIRAQAIELAPAGVREADGATIAAEHTEYIWGTQSRTDFIAVFTAHTRGAVPLKPGGQERGHHGSTGALRDREISTEN
jgi:hypothetical protein